jgi:hypothetical protein
MANFKSPLNRYSPSVKPKTVADSGLTNFNEQDAPTGRQPITSGNPNNPFTKPVKNVLPPDYKKGDQLPPSITSPRNSGFFASGSDLKPGYTLDATPGTTDYRQREDGSYGPSISGTRIIKDANGNVVSTLGDQNWLSFFNEPTQPMQPLAPQDLVPMTAQQTMPFQPINKPTPVNRSPAKFSNIRNFLNRKRNF